MERYLFKKVRTLLIFKCDLAQLMLLRAAVVNKHVPWPCAVCNTFLIWRSTESRGNRQTGTVVSVCVSFFMRHTAFFRSPVYGRVKVKGEVSRVGVIWLYYEMYPSYPLSIHRLLALNIVLTVTQSPVWVCGGSRAEIMSSLKSHCFISSSIKQTETMQRNVRRPPPELNSRVSRLQTPQGTLYTHIMFY